MGWGQRIEPTLDLTQFEREVIVESLRFFADNADRGFGDGVQVRAKRKATARDLALRFA